jgi:hypothetical protein
MELNEWTVNPTSVRAFVTLKSKGTVDRKPDNASIGGFCVTDTEGNEWIFDWLSSEGNAELDENFNLIIEWELREFDEELFINSNLTPNLLNWDSIVKGSIQEIYYEAFNTDGYEERDIPMFVSDFILTIWDKSTQTTLIKSFTQEQLDKYNNLI